MDDNEFFAYCDKLLKEASTEKEYKAIQKLFNYIDNSNAIEKGHGIVCSCEPLCSMEWYYLASKMTDVFAKNSIIIDCGSCVPIQQVFFKKFKKYIAIDMHFAFDKYIKPLANAEFIQGNIIEVLPELRKKYPKQRLIGISHLCVSYFCKKDNRLMEEFDKTFDFKITC